LVGDCIASRLAEGGRMKDRERERERERELNARDA